MIRRFPPAAIAATVLALSLTASVSMAEDGHLGPLAQELKTALAADPVEVTQKGFSVMLTSSADAMFPSGGWQVPSSAPLLDKMLPTLSRLQHTNIVVGGYTDNVPVGEELKAKGVSNNLDLSAERAVSIANYLTSHGVKPDLVSAHGFGETNPVASNDTPEGRAKNRRVDITLTGEPAAAQVDEKEAYEIGVEAYVYLYPLITMDVTRKVMTNYEPGQKPGAGPMNTFCHLTAFPTADFRDVVRPNFDTLYSPAWLDLTNEPMIVSVPDTNDRYYLLPMIDMWSDVIAVPGKRTSGTKAGNWAVVPPGWKGSLPEGVERIDAPTQYIWIIARTQTNGAKDYDAVHKVQAGYKITPLSQWGSEPQPVAAKIDPAVDMKTEPLQQVNGMPAGKYFAYGAELMKRNPPHVTDWSLVARMKRIGLEPGKPFDLDKADPAVRAALERAAADSLKAMKAKVPTLARVVNGWQMNTDTMGVYGDYYQKRAIIALVGLGANQPEDAIYPLCVGDADGKPLQGENKYVLHFEKAELPPVNAFWSVTMYDAEGFQVANPIDRFAIGDRDKLKFNEDGSLDLYIQHESPGKDKESNWLPAPKSGELGVTMRLYAPKPEALDGRWNPPPFKRAK